MKNVLLLGDSIRMNYCGKVAEILKDEAVTHYTGENNRFAKYLLWGIHDYFARWDMNYFDIIHFNAGSWDVNRVTGDGVFTPIGEYSETIKRIGILLKKHCGKLIFATTTPCGADIPDYSPVDTGGTGAIMGRVSQDTFNSDVARYNRAAIEALDGIIDGVDDLNALISSDIPRYICDDSLHLSEDGIEAAARQVAESVRRFI